MKDGYSLTRRWYDWCFRHSGHHTPAHAALYNWFVEANNRVSWAEEFEMAPQYAMTAIGVRSYNTYKDTLADLQAWGFVHIRQKGANQYVPWLIALSNFDEPLNNPLDKSTGVCSSKIDIPLNKARNKAPDKASSNGSSKFDNPCNNPLDEACNEACNNPRDAITINNKGESLNEKLETFTNGARENSTPVDAEKKDALTPQPPAPKPIPIPPGKIYGDGKLQANLIDFYRQYPDMFPLAIYLPFLRYWTATNQKGDVARIGWERWRVLDTWDLEIRLNAWNERELKGKPTNGNSRTSTDFLNRQRAAEPQTIDDYGDL
ncbi:hypothetical protein [Spirosoma aerophilum]